MEFAGVSLTLGWKFIFKIDLIYINMADNFLQQNKTNEQVQLTFKCLILLLQTFANWGVDYLKVDGCFSNPAAFDDGFPKFTQAFNATGRPVLLSYEWPLYQSQVGIKV